MLGKAREGGPLRATLSTGQGWMRMETYLLDSAMGPVSDCHCQSSRWEC